MQMLRPVRRLATGMPCMLVAALVLLSRLIAPALAIPAVDPAGLLALQTICHAEAPVQPGPPAQPDHAACLLCPACHLVAQAVLPTPPAPLIPPPPRVAIGIAAPLPPATGPPSPVRTAAQPTGPPSLSA